MQCYLILMCSFKSAYKAQSLMKISKISFMLFSYLLIFIKADKHLSINTATSWLLHNYNDKTACMHYRKTEVSVFFKLLADCIFIQFQECKKGYQHTWPGFLKQRYRQGFFISHFYVEQSGHDNSETKPVGRIPEPKLNWKNCVIHFPKW